LAFMESDTPIRFFCTTWFATLFRPCFFRSIFLPDATTVVFTALRPRVAFTFRVAPRKGLVWAMAAMVLN